MYILLVLLIVVATTTVLQRQKIPAVVNLTVLGLLLFVCLTLVARSFMTTPRSPAPDELISTLESFDRASSYRLGLALANDIPPGASILVVHRGAYNPVAQRLLDGKLDALRNGLGAPYTLHVEGLPDDPHRHFVDETDTPRSGDVLVYDLLEEEPYFPDAVFAQLIARYPSASAVVSFVGPPRFYNGIPHTIPPLYVMGGDDDELARELFRHGVVRACVAHRTSGVDWLAQPRRGMSLDDIFDLRSELLHAAN